MNRLKTIADINYTKKETLRFLFCVIFYIVTSNRVLLRQCVFTLIRPSTSLRGAKRRSNLAKKYLETLHHNNAQNKAISILMAAKICKCEKHNYSKVKI